MSLRRMDHQATLLPNGRVLITGGLSGEGGAHTIAECEMFRTASGDFVPAGELIAPVHEHQATLLASGEVLVTGGMVVSGERHRAVPLAQVIEP